MKVELNIGSLGQLKKAIQDHEKDDFGNKKRARGQKYSYENDKMQVVDRIDRILEYKGKIDKWLDDIGEMLARLKKQEVTFLEEKLGPPIPPTQSPPDAPLTPTDKGPSDFPPGPVVGDTPESIKGPSDSPLL